MSCYAIILPGNGRSYVQYPSKVPARLQAQFQVSLLTVEIKLGHGGVHTLFPLFWKPKGLLNVPRVMS